MSQMIHFEFTEKDGSRTKTSQFKRGVEGLTDLGVRTMVVEYAKMGKEAISVFLDGIDATDTFRPTPDDIEIVNSLRRNRNSF